MSARQEIEETLYRYAGTYEDEFVRAGGQWLIARRRARSDG